MKLTLDTLKVLDVIVEEGGLNRAAAVLHRVPSTLSHAVNKLEGDLGFAIFRRDGGRLHLTDAGEELVTKGRILLAQAQELEENAQRISSGWESRLRLAVADIVPLSWLLPHVKRLGEIAPHIQVALQRESLGGSWDAVQNGRADLAIGAQSLSDALQDSVTLYGEALGVRTMRKHFASFVEWAVSEPDDARAWRGRLCRAKSETEARSELMAFAQSRQASAA